MYTASTIINKVNNNWMVDSSKLTKKEKEIEQQKVEVVAASVINQVSSAEDNSWSNWGNWGVQLLADTVTDVVANPIGLVDEVYLLGNDMVNTAYQAAESLDAYLGETPYDVAIRERNNRSLETIGTEIQEHINQLKTLDYKVDLVRTNAQLIEMLNEYKTKAESEYNIKNEFDALEETIKNLKELQGQLVAQAEEEARDNSLGNQLANWMSSIGDTANAALNHVDSALDELAEITSSLTPDQTTLLGGIKDIVTQLLPAENNGALYTPEETEKINAIKQKVEQKQKLSQEEITDLLTFVERQKTVEKGIAEYLTEAAIYDYGYVTKNFLSLTGATIAGMLAGPTAAFAAHNVIGSLYQNWVNDAKPNNQVEQLAALMVNGAVGFATGGSGAAVANVTAQVVEDVAPENVRDGIAAASIGYLAHLTGASPAITMQVGLIGLLALKGRQIAHAIKEDANAVVSAIKNPLTLSGAAFGFITNIANGILSACIEKRWDEVGALGTVTVISLGTLILGSSVAGGIAVALLGVYLTNRFFHSDDIYKGGATLANSSFREWVAKQTALVEDAETQMASLNAILQSKSSDANDVKRTAEIISLLTTPVVQNNNQ
ncbi:MAG: hypothetical protein ACXWM7_04405 [Parachlamydiaceae bacterium]